MPSETSNIGLRVSSRANSLSRSWTGTHNKTGSSSPPFPKSKPVTRGTRENQTRWFEAQRQRPQPRPCEPVQPVRPAGHLLGLGGGQIRLGGLTGVGGDPTQACFLLGRGWEGGGRADAQLRNWTCQPAGAIFCRSEPLTDGVIMGGSGECRRVRPPSSPKPLPLE